MGPDMSETKARPRRPLPPLMSLTDTAAARLRALYEKGEANGQEGKLLRIGVRTRGCSGLSYDLTWVDAAGPGDETIADKGVTVIVDRKATLFLIGTTMDYETTPFSQGFTFTNPNEKGRCGCGESFHV
jgi:iron-sulfur cluster assembly protein